VSLSPLDLGPELAAADLPRPSEAAHEGSYGAEQRAEGDSRSPSGAEAALATSAAAGGASERAIMAQTGHRSADMVRRYIREANLFAAGNAASLAGL
jgi:integrase